jgi:hypothetical protein
VTLVFGILAPTLRPAHATDMRRIQQFLKVIATACISPRVRHAAASGQSHIQDLWRHFYTSVNRSRRMAQHADSKGRRWVPLQGLTDLKNAQPANAHSILKINGFATGVA